jgi:hypothetical protein
MAVNVTLEGRVAVITIDRHQRRNAVDRRVQRVPKLDKENSLNVAVLTGVRGIRLWATLGQTCCIAAPLTARDSRGIDSRCRTAGDRLAPIWPVFGHDKFKQPSGDFSTPWDYSNAEQNRTVYGNERWHGTSVGCGGCGLHDH